VLDDELVCGVDNAEPRQKVGVFPSLLLEFREWRDDEDRVRWELGLLLLCLADCFRLSNPATRITACFFSLPSFSVDTILCTEAPLYNPRGVLK